MFLTYLFIVVFMFDIMTFFKNIKDKYFEFVENKIFIKKKMMNLGSFGKIRYNLFKEKETLLLGQFVNGEIWLNSRLFKLYSRKVQQYVVLHEIGHQKSNKLFLITDALGLFLFFFGILLFVAVLVPTSIIFLAGGSLEISFSLILFFIMILFGKLLKSLSESKADFFAIDNLSVKDYLKITDEISSKRPKTGLFYQLVRLCYPNPKIVALVYNILHR